MEISQDYLKKFKKEEKKSTWYQELGRELTEYFGKNCYFIPHRYEQWKIRAKFKEIQQIEGKKNKSLAYFLGMLKN